MNLDCSKITMLMSGRLFWQISNHSTRWHSASLLGRAYWTTCHQLDHVLWHIYWMPLGVFLHLQNSSLEVMCISWTATHPFASFGSFYFFHVTTCISRQLFIFSFCFINIEWVVIELFSSGLSFNTDDKTLKEAFSSFGNVLEGWWSLVTKALLKQLLAVYGSLCLWYF